MVGARDRRERRQERRAREDALGVVGVQPHLLPLVRASADPASARSEGGPRPARGRGRAPRAGSWRRPPHRSGNAAPPRSPAPPRRPSDRTGRARSDRRSRRSPPARDRSPRPPASTGGCGSQASVSSQADASLVEREDLARHRRRGRRRPRGSNACPARSRTTRTARLSPPSMRWKAASRATCTIRIASGISSPFARPSQPLPSQRSVRWTKRSRTGGGRPEPRGEHLRHLADRGQVRIPLPRRLRQPARDLDRARGRRTSGRRQRAQDPGEHLASRPERHRGEVGRPRAAEDLRSHLGIGGAARVRSAGTRSTSATPLRGRPRGGQRAASRSACCAARARTGSPCRGRWPGTAPRPPPRHGRVRRPGTPRPPPDDGTRTPGIGRSPDCPGPGPAPSVSLDPYFYS